MLDRRESETKVAWTCNMCREGVLTPQQGGARGYASRRRNKDE